MTIKILGTNIRTRHQYDISEIVINPKWTTSIDSQPGKLEFSVMEDKNFFFKKGDIVEMSVSGRKIFKGKVFRNRKGKPNIWNVVAYDNMRYLQNEDTLVFPANSCVARFRTICQTQGMAHKVLDNSSYNCTPVIKDKHTYFSMIDDSVEETRNGNGVRYGIWDNYGTLEIFSLNRMITKVVIGDNSLLTDYDYESSIDDAFNAVKVIREDEKKNKREIFTATHKGNIDLWGKLQMVEVVTDADLNSSQLQRQANDLLRENNKETKTLDLDAIGYVGLRAGNSFILRIEALQRDGVGKDSLALIRSVTHDFSSIHTMSLSVEVLA